MSSPTEESLEIGLDPQDWDAFRRLAHRALDDALDSLATVREQPVWQGVPDAVRAEFRTPLPRKGTGAEAAYADYRRLVAPYPLGNIHPRFWGWVNGSGTPMGVVAEMLAATMNVNAAGFDQSSTYVELQVIEWFKELMGFPAAAGGILVTGGSVSNLVGLNVARSAMAPFAVRREGLSGQPRLMYYTSSETHNSAQKAVELMGLGDESLARIPVDADYRMDVAALKARIAADRREGRLPVCVVANAGTVNTGAVDDLEAIADLCRDEKLWLHVDGAFGAFAVLDPEKRALVKGMERADSLAFDLHKWMYLPYDVGCVLVRDNEKHKAAFAVAASYLSKLEGGIAAAPIAFADYGPQLSRGFRALKVWLNLKAHGADAFARLISQNLEQARYLERRVAAEPELELLAPVPLNVVNFRYRRAGLDEKTLNYLNARILVALQERGIAAPSSTVLDGRFAIRVAITNHRSRREDFDALADAVLALGKELELT
ncbi:MAG TPA: aminotransferase class V-fold PLP-dependent enzyme [Gammaproteobacteria bacterium]|jgi:glutamate/tyrosine decarboxylase-like PLP-dependent enzyme